MEFKILQKALLFKGVSDKFLKEFAEMVEIRKCDKDEIIIEEGSRTKELFIIISGNAKISVGLEDETGKFNLEVFEVGIGEIFGEYSLLTSRPRSATVRAAKDIELLIINRQSLEKLENSGKPGMIFYKNMARMLSNRIISSDENVKVWFKNLL